MKKARLEDMTRGWFIGNFDPVVLRTAAFEMGVKRYRAGEKEQRHYHRLAVEVTVIVSGTVKMNGIEYTEGDIIALDPGDATDFVAVTDAVTCVAKMPSVLGDKYLTDE